MQEFRSFVDRACADCPHIRYCRGGCPYNAMVPGHGTIGGVDPYCRAYHRIFDEISGRLNSEMAEAPAMEMMCFGAPRQKQDKPGVMALMRFQAMKEGRRKR